MISRMGEMLELRVNAGAAKEMAIPFAVKVCPTPTCACQRLTFILPEQPAARRLDGKAKPRTEFVIDWSDGITGSKEVLSAVQLARMNEFLETADDADHEEFGRIFVERKQSVIFNGPLDEVPSDWAAALDLSVVVFIRDIFPLAAPLEFEHDGLRYEVLDCYCLAEGCDCRELTLQFAKIPKDPGELTRTTFAAVRYNLRDGSVIPHSPKDQARLGVLLPQFSAKLSGITDSLKQRYGRVRQLVMEKPPTQTTVKPAPVVNPPKPGRNDPCSCGSGKKYKKCCGA